MSNEGLKNFLIISPAVALMAMAGLYLYKDYQENAADDVTEAEEILDPVGTVSYGNNNVKRKSGGSPYWNKVEKGETLYNNDSIRTGPDSFAVIKLNDSSIIEVNENSLIGLQKNQSQLAVDLKLGDMAAKSKSQDLKIKVKDSSILSKDGEVKLKTDNQNNTQVVVTQGQATLTDNKTNKTETLSRQKSAKIDARGETQTTMTWVVLNTPKEDQHIVDSNAKINYPFTWNVLQDSIKEEIFELSPTKDFKQAGLYSRKAHQAIQAPISKGTWFWRIGYRIPNEQKIYYTETRSFKMAEDQRMTLNHPKDGANFEVTPEDDALEFSWSSQITDAKIYLLEISTTQDFQKITKTKTTEKVSINVDKFATGSYYWRARAFSKDNKEIARSATESFRIKKSVPQLPNLIAPKNNANLNPQPQISFEWEPHQSAAQYRILISKDLAQKEVLKSQTTLETKYAWKNNQLGFYFWSVEALSSDNIVIGQSTVNKLQVSKNTLETIGITLVQPIDQATIQRALKDNVEPIVFDWKADKPLPPPFSIWISTKSDFKEDSILRTVDTQKYAHQFEKAGTYYWKVNWTNPANPKEIISSQTNVFSVKVVKKLMAPILNEPLADAKFVIPEKSPVTFRWNAVEGAVLYRLVVEKKDPSTENSVVVDKQIKDLEFTTLPIDPGFYSWHVSAIDKENVEGLSSPSRSLILELKKELTAPKLKPIIVK